MKIKIKIKIGRSPFDRSAATPRFLRIQAAGKDARA
jgi:hypothetical protein